MSTAHDTDEILDYAVVGGGISGLYAGWRLLTGAPNGGAPAKRIVVFETSGRTGGRLMTWYPFPDNTELHGELGGMRFFQGQGLVWGLITEHFGNAGKLKKPIKFYVTDPNGNNLWYLRERILHAADFNDPKRVPYRQDADARYAGPFGIIGNVIASVLAENRREIAGVLGGRTQPQDWEDWDKIKPLLRYRGRKLWNIGFWNLLYDLLSPESYAYVTAAFGYSSVTNNWNAAEAMQSVFIDFTTNPDYQTLREGYGYLPYLVRGEFENAGGEVRRHHTVIDVLKEGDHFALSVAAKSGGTTTHSTVRAHRVILAMPRRSLELLRPNRFWDLDRPVGTSTLRHYVESVIPYPAFKMFLAYDQAWWRNAPMSIGAGRSVSDLPIRQSYYFPPEPNPFPPDKVPQVKQALLMASYDDYVSVPFWETLEAPEEYRAQADEGLRAAPAAYGEQKLSGIERYVSEVNDALADEPGFHLAPPEMVRYAQQQLRLVHYNQVQPDPIPFDDQTGKLQGYFLAAYQNWGHDPYGGGWNFWAPAVDVRDVMETMRQPFAGEELYVIGEAYSGSQGWVEGALTTTERTLQDKLGLAPPPWQPKGYYMGY